MFKINKNKNDYFATSVVLFVSIFQGNLEEKRERIYRIHSLNRFVSQFILYFIDSGNLVGSEYFTDI